MDLLYKYVSAKRVLTCLPDIGDGTLRATQPSALNDPFECTVTKTFVEQDKKGGNKRLASVLTSIHSISPVSESDIVNAAHKYGSLYMRELLSKQLSQRFGVISFASDPRHPLMWSHYTLDGSGFAVGYDAEQLRTLVGRQGRFRPVKYAAKPAYIIGYGVLLDEETINVLLSYKSDNWSYEKEWRLIVELNETIGTGRKDQHGQPINLLRIPNSAVMSVHYTERTPGEAVREVRKRLESTNNRYRAESPTKLVLSETKYGYVDESARSVLRK